jgi:hypothetical protein
MITHKNQISLFALVCIIFFLNIAGFCRGEEISGNFFKPDCCVLSPKLIISSESFYKSYQSYAIFDQNRQEPGFFKTAGFEQFGHRITAFPEQQLKAFINELVAQGNPPGAIHKFFQLLDKKERGEIDELVLDIGAGSMRPAKALAKKNPRLGIVSIDLYGLKRPGKEGLYEYSYYDSEKEDIEYFNADLHREMLPYDNISVLSIDMEVFMKYMPETVFDTVLFINPNHDLFNRFFAILSDFKVVHNPGKVILKAYGPFKGYSDAWPEKVRFKKGALYWNGVDLDWESEWGRRVDDDFDLHDPYVYTWDVDYSKLTKQGTEKDVMIKTVISAVSIDRDTASKPAVEEMELIGQAI